MLEYKPVNLRARRLAIEAYKLQDLLHIKSIVISLGVKIILHMIGLDGQLAGDEQTGISSFDKPKLAQANCHLSAYLPAFLYGVKRHHAIQWTVPFPQRLAFSVVLLMAQV